MIGGVLQIKLSFLYPATTGRNMDEVLRVIESLQKASKFKIATPANWKPGDPVVISPSVTNEQAKEMFPQGFDTVELPSKKKYLRFTKVWFPTPFPVSRKEDKTTLFLFDVSFFHFSHVSPKFDFLLHFLYQGRRTRQLCFCLMYLLVVSFVHYSNIML